MAIFGSKKKTVGAKAAVAEKTIAKKAEAKSASAPKAVVVLNTNAVHSIMTVADVILRPHITERASMLNEKHNIYTFQVAKDSTKKTIAKAMQTLYKVTPTAVRVVSLPAKSVFIRGKRGTQSGMKKAYVTLKKGDKIEVA